MNDDSLEDGEIVDNDDAYTPLERPSDYSACQGPNPRFQSLPESESEPELQSTDSDSDSDGPVKNKKPKAKLKPKPKRLDPKRKKYDIWSTRVQEDVLSETLNSCDVTKKDRSRDVESYDYLGNHFYEGRSNNKRSRSNRRNANLKLVGRQKSEECDNKEEDKGSVRIILDLVVTSESSAEDIAEDIANKLCENKEDLILRVVNTIGKDRAFALFEETKRIEKEGGMLIMNQTRRRTPGGVFLFLLRHDDNITAKQKDKIFEEDRHRHKLVLRNKQKTKMDKVKAEIAMSKSKLLPALLTRAELLTDQTRKLKETEERDVINPPPTPETDNHENSGDGMDNATFNGTDMVDDDENKRKLETYDDDFLDIGTSADMDLF